MNLMELAIKVGVDDQTQGPLNSIGSTAVAKGVAIGNAMWDAMKGVGNAVVAAGKQALSSYSDYEQLTGGVKKLFGSASGQVMKDAKNAYKTSGMSANQYMQQATSFSASLISSLGGDTQQAAKLSNVAMKSMSDNVNTFGSSMTDVQNAYQGFAKQNYTMLDNLKLGYGGTKEEMARLVKDAASYKKEQADLNETVDAGSMSFDNIVKAIDVVQKHQNIWGTTSREAATTIQGSIDMAKAAWENWMTGLGDDSADMGELTKELISSLGTVADNVGPAIARIASAFANELPSALSQAWDKAKQALQGAMSSQGIDLSGLFKGIDNAAQAIAPIGDDIKSALKSDEVKDAVNGITDAVGKLVDTFGKIVSAVKPIAPALAPLVAALLALKTVGTIVAVITAVAKAFSMIQTVIAAGGMIQSFAGLGAVISTLAGGPLVLIVGAIVAVIAIFATLMATNEDFRNTVIGIWNAVVNAVKAAFDWFVNLPATLGNLLASADAAVASWINNFITGAVQAGSGFLSAIVGFFTQLPGAIGGFLTSVITTVASWVGFLVANAVTAGSNFLTNIVTFFSQLPGNVLNFLTSVITSVAGWASSMAAQAASAGSRFLTGVVLFVQQLPGRIAGFLSSAIGRVAGFASQLGSQAANAGSRFLSGIQHGFNSAVSFVSGIPGRILGALGNVGSLLANAGKSIMNGLLNGIKAGFNKVKDFVSGIAGTIAKLKGPIEYDRVLLIPQGNAIMQGLLGGLTEGFEGGVMPYVSSMAGRMSGGLGSVPLGASGTAGSPTETAVTRWLDQNLGPIIAQYAPTATPREFGRMTRRYA